MKLNLFVSVSKFLSDLVQTMDECYIRIEISRTVRWWKRILRLVFVVRQSLVL